MRAARGEGADEDDEPHEPDEEGSDDVAQLGGRHRRGL
jgi:hypothetical protein